MLATTVADAADVLDVVAGPDPRDRFSLPDTGADYAAALAAPLGELRVAWSPDLGYAAVEPGVRALDRRGRGRLRIPRLRG